MKLVVLGSGSAVPHPFRSGSAYWLETSSGTILLDCAASAGHRMAQEKLDWTRLDAIWISHFHLDHVGGLAPFLFGTRNAEAMKERAKPLKIFGAKGLEKLVEAFDEVNNYKLFRQPFPLEIVEVEEHEEFEILPATRAVAIKTPHTDESLAIHLRDKDDKTLVYSSDTGFTKTLGAFARAADLFVLECSFFKNKPIEKHLELEEAMFLIRYAAPKKALLTHFYAEWDAVYFDREIEKYEPSCAVIAARDGLRLEI
ncbi:MAG TPA: ribonuclease Z [Pyrinomonadaceae bacterium]|jgi:ribonuclease BN (tRNA processing enzyme)